MTDNAFQKDKVAIITGLRLVLVLQWPNVLHL